MIALDVYTKINIKDYLAKPEAKFDKEYSEERKKSLRRFLLIAIILVIFSPLLTLFLTIISFIILINFYKSEIITFLDDLGK